MLPAAKTMAPLGAVYRVASECEATPLSAAGTFECPTRWIPGTLELTKGARLGSELTGNVSNS